MKVDYKKILEHVRLYLFIVINLIIIVGILASYWEINDIRFMGSLEYPWFYQSKKVYIAYISMFNIVFGLCVFFGIRFYLKRRFVLAFAASLLPYVWGIISSYINF